MAMLNRKRSGSASSSGFAARTALACLSLTLITGCASLPRTGPSTSSIMAAGSGGVDNAPVHVIDVSMEVAAKLRTLTGEKGFSAVLGDGKQPENLVSQGDIVQVMIWEAPPAVLLSPSALGASDGLDGPSSSGWQMPEQMIGSAGTIRVPFVGAVAAANRTTDAIAEDIRRQLLGKAHDPQVFVRVVRNATSNVTIVGEVATSLRMPLTPKHERLLDALAAAGGVKQPIDKMTVQVTRGDRVYAMPLAAVIKNPQENVHLQADDIVTLLFQPYSLTVLGAAGKNEEIPFEGSGVTLSQALGRIGGLQDQRANPRGVFIFRFEDPKGLFAGQSVPTTQDGKVPVIYRVNMMDPATLFVAQSFPIKDKDVIYVSNAPLADFSKFLQAVSQIVYPISVIQTTNIF